MKIPGYTLYGDYYLADNVIRHKNWEEACEMKEIITLPNGKKVVAHTLSKEELETIPQKQRNCCKWYWTSTPNDDNVAWCVTNIGDFYDLHSIFSFGTGGVRLGFHKNEIKQFLNIE